MGRASLLQMSRERIQAASNSASPIPDQLQSRTDLATLCVDAAKATIELVLVLKKHNLLCRFSFTDHHASAAALIILILHSILQHGDETSRIIDDGIEMLRYMAYGGCRGASSDLQTVEHLRKLASDLRQKIYQDESESSTQVPMQPTSMATSYQAWVSWMSEQEASRSRLPELNNPSFQSGPETLNGVSDIRGYERSGIYEAGPSSNVPDMLDYRSIDPGSFSWNLNTFNGFAPQVEIPRGFDWDDGRLDVLDMTQFLGGYGGQTTYGKG